MGELCQEQHGENDETFHGSRCRWVIHVRQWDHARSFLRGGGGGATVAQKKDGQVNGSSSWWVTFPRVDESNNGL